MLLSEHFRRYRGVTAESLETFKDRLISLFPVGQQVSQASLDYLADFVAAISTEYLKAKEPRPRVEPMEASTPRPQEEPFSASGGLNESFGRSFAANVPPIKLNQLVKKPEEFNGFKPHPRMWIENYIDAIEDNGWTEQVAIKYVKTFLTGKAADWFKLEVRPFLTGNTSWQDFYGMFAGNFLGAADRQRTRRMVNDARQGLNESVSTFIPGFKRLLFLLNPDLSETEVVERVTEKLRPEYRRVVCEKEPKTLVGLRDICRRLEAGIDAVRESNAPTSNNRLASKQPYSAPQARFSGNKSKPNPTSGKPSITREKTNTDRSKQTDKCYRCDREGHIRAKCIARTKADGSPLAPPKVNVAEGPQEDSEGSDQEVTVIKHCNAIIVSNASGAPSSTSKMPELMTKSLSCDGLSVVGIVDTGSQVSLISLACAKRNGWLDKKNAKTVELLAANASKFVSEGSITLNISLKIGKIEKQKRHVFLIIANLPSDLLIGLDLLRALGVMIDTQSLTWVFKKDPSMSQIRAKDTMKVPARTQLAVPSSVKRVGTVIISPIYVNNALAVAHSVNEIHNGFTAVWLANYSNEDVIIRRNQVIAKCEARKESLEDVSTPAKSPTQVNSTMIIEGTAESVKVGDKLTPSQLQDLQLLLNANVGAFSVNGKLGCTSVLNHHIELLPGAKPFADRLRRRPQVEIDETRRQVQQMLAEGVIEPSDSPWASAYLLVKKKTGDMRLCLDFRKLNDMTVKCAYPMPNIEQCLDSLAGKVYFSNLDLASGYWQVPMSKASKPLTAFRTEDGLFQCVRMPFGLSNAPATFQKMMNLIFAGLRGFNLQIFIDDVCVATHSWQEHLNMLEKVFSIIQRSGLKLKASKCVFGTNSVTFLGHQVSRDGIRQDPTKLRALTQLKAPTNVKEARRVLGMFGYYRRFVPKYAELTEPMVKLTKKSQAWIWGEEQEHAFRSVIKHLESDLVLSHYTHDDPLMIKTDASLSGIAGMLFQQKHGEWRLVTCVSRNLKPSEKNYGVTDLEGLAVVYTITKLRPYILGKEVLLLTDHCALCVLNKTQPTSARLRRWAILLSEYNLKIEYTSGASHQDIDCLSRSPVDDANDEMVEHAVMSVVPIGNGWSEYSDDEAKELLEQAKAEVSDLTIQNGLIYSRGRLYVPKPKRIATLAEAHSSSMGGHGGVLVTQHKMSDFWWPNWRKDVVEYVNNCIRCQARKVERRGEAGGMQHFTYLQPLQCVAVDTLGPLTESNDGMRHIIVAIDCFSRFVEAKAIRDLKASQTTDFLREYFGRYGLPSEILSDGGPGFSNNLVADMLAELQIKHRESCPGHSRGNSQVERVIGVLQEKLSLSLNDDDDEKRWDQRLPMVLYAINTSFHKSINCSPYELTFGRKPALSRIASELYKHPQELYLKALKSEIERTQKAAVNTQQLAQRRSEPYFMHGRRDVHYAIGDRVWVRVSGKREGTKLSNKFNGPYSVVESANDIYLLKDENTNRTISRHTSCLKPYKSNESAPQDYRRHVRLRSRVNTALLLCMLIMVSRSEALFEPIPPWVLQTVDDKIVFGSFVSYETDLIFKGPCIQLRDEFRDQNRDVSESLYTCDQEMERWKQAMKDLSNLRPALQDRLSKRQLGAVLVVGSVFCNMVSSITVTGKVGRLASEVKAFRDEFYDTTRVLDQSLSLVTRGLRVVTGEVEDLLQKLPKLITSIVQATLNIASYLSDMRLVEDFAGRTGGVALRPLSRILNMSELVNGSSEHSRFVSATALDDYAYRLRYDVMYPANDTLVFKLDPFEIWTSLGHMPTLMKCFDIDLVLYNFKNNCLRTIFQPASKIITETCDEPNYRDPKLDLCWKPIQQLTSASQIPERSIVKLSRHSAYIYCFPGTIDIEKERYVCPNHVFKLGLTTWFDTSDGFHFHPKYVKNEAVISAKLDNIFPAHFHPNRLANETRMIVTELEGLQQRLRKPAIMSITLGTYDPVWWAILIILLAISSFFAYNWFKTYQLRKTLLKQAKMWLPTSELKTIPRTTRQSTPRAIATVPSKETLQSSS